MTIDAMRARSELVTKTREFFFSRDYIETDTPLLAPWLIPESSLEAFATEFKHPKCLPALQVFQERRIPRPAP